MQNCLCRHFLVKIWSLSMHQIHAETRCIQVDSSGIMHLQGKVKQHYGTTWKDLIVGTVLSQPPTFSKVNRSGKFCRVNKQISTSWTVLSHHTKRLGTDPPTLKEEKQATYIKHGDSFIFLWLRRSSLDPLHTTHLIHKESESAAPKEIKKEMVGSRMGEKEKLSKYWLGQRDECRQKPFVILF